jgi:hypothetical protein
MAAKAAIRRSPQASPAQDPFQAVLQGRLVAHLRREVPKPAAADTVKAKAGDGLSKGQRQILQRRLPPERLPEVAGVLLLAGFPAERLQALLADPQVQQQGLSLGELRQAWLEAQGSGARTPQGASQAKGEGFGLLTEEPLPPALAALLDLAAQSPEGVLPVPSSRRPEIAALLGEAGFSPKQVETLLTSPQVQERGLTAEMLQAAWLKSVQGHQTEPAKNSSPGAEPSVTSRADYQRLWERLRLPAEVFPDLRLALQQLGASPEALASLEEHATPQGIPVGQVWQVIKQCLMEGRAANKPMEPTAPPSGPEVEQWRQLLLQAGFSPEAVEGLLGLQPPASMAQLRERLAALAPSDSPPQGDKNPKPLYLPANLRLRSLSWESRPDPEPGLGEQKDGQETAAGRGELAAPQTLASENAAAFSTFLAPLGAPPPAAGSNTGGSPLTLSPEVRQAFWSQLEAGILANLRPGETRLNLSLDPPQLGHIELTLNLKGENLAVTAVITRPEAAHLAGAGLEQLVQALSQQGLILSQFQVRLPGGVGEPHLLVTQAGKIMEKKTPSSGDGGQLRRRGTGKVDRFA